MSNVNGTVTAPITVTVDPQVGLQAELDRLRAENAALKARPGNKLTFKVGKKGGVSVYGLGRFPVTLYAEQWLRLLGMNDDIRAFITKNQDEIDRKSAISKAEKEAEKEAKK